MLKLVIVDDEEYVIKGLKKFIDWEALGVEITDSASNGSEGLEKILHHQPDIVLADIKMPIMDGLQMIRECHEKGINSKYVVLSGYGEFEYAREGIKYGVIDYILKPSTPDEITEVMKKAVTVCLDEKEKAVQDTLLKERLKQSIPILTEKFIEEIFEGNIPDEPELREKAEFLNLDIENKEYRVLALQIDSYSEFIEKSNEEERQLKKISILSKACKLFNVTNTYLNFIERSSHLLLVMDPEPINYDQNKMIEKKAQWLIEEVSRSLGVSLSIGVGEPVRSLRKIADSFSQSKECLKFKLQFGYGKVIFYEDIVCTQIKVPVLNLYNKDQLIDALKTRDKNKISDCIKSFISNIREYKFILLDYVKLSLIEMVGIVSLTLYQIGEKETNILHEATLWKDIEEIETAREIEAWLTNFFDVIFSTITQKNNQRITRVLEQIIEYIQANYNKDISIEDISKRIFLTPNYLSNIFSKNMGENFTKYLVRYRIEKAKELLRTGKYKVYEISEMVGYKNTDYFSRIFKEYSGVTPSEY